MGVRVWKDRPRGTVFELHPPCPGLHSAVMSDVTRLLDAAAASDRRAAPKRGGGTPAGPDADRLWAYAKAWLYRDLSVGGPGD